MSNNSWKV